MALIGMGIFPLSHFFPTLVQNWPKINRIKNNKNTEKYILLKTYRNKQKYKAGTVGSGVVADILE